MTAPEMEKRLVEMSTAFKRCSDDTERERIRAEYRLLHAQWIATKET